jgi:hypothetical protein
MRGRRTHFADRFQFDLHTSSLLTRELLEACQDEIRSAVDRGHGGITHLASVEHIAFGPSNSPCSPSQ